MPWAGGGRAASTAARGRAVVNAMAMPAFTDKWMRLSPPERRLSGIRVAELPDPASEAQAIGLQHRSALARGSKRGDGQGSMREAGRGVPPGQRHDAR